MQRIVDILKYPDNTPIEAVQAKLVKIYERNLRKTKYGEKSVQRFVLDDGSEKIPCEIWEHPEIKQEHLNKEYVFSSSSNGKGISVKHDNYKTPAIIMLSLGKAANIQHVAVYHEKKGTTPDAAPSPQAAPSGATPRAQSSSIRGDLVGMAIKGAIDLEIAVKGSNASISGVQNKSMDIIKLSNFLQEGGWQHPSKEANTAPVAAPSPKAESLGDEKPDEDVPY